MFQRQVLGEQTRRYDQNEARLDQSQTNLEGQLSPYISGGASAFGLISDLYGLNGGQGFGESALARFRASPDYAFTFDEGRRAMENSAAARGNLLSGNFARGITQYGQNSAMGFLDNYTKRLLGIADMGRGSALSGGQLAMSRGGGLPAFGQFASGMAGQIGSSYGNIGAAQASGIVGGANAMTGGINSGLNNYMFYNALGRNGQSSYSPNAGLPVINPGVSGGGYLGGGGEVFPGPGYYQ
jgi:hypothetical protein